MIITKREWLHGWADYLWAIEFYSVIDRWVCYTHPDSVEVILAHEPHKRSKYENK